MEQERLRQEAIKQAEKERRDKYKKQEDEREVLRQGIRDKVRLSEESGAASIFRRDTFPVDIYSTNGRFFVFCNFSF